MNCERLLHRLPVNRKIKSIWPELSVTLDASLTSWLSWLIVSMSRAKGPYIYNLPYAYAYALTWDASPWSWCISSYSHHLHTRHQTVLRLTIQVHMQHWGSWQLWVRGCEACWCFHIFYAPSFITDCKLNGLVTVSQYTHHVGSPLV
jgi:hypothetical protein